MKLGELANKLHCTLLGEPSIEIVGVATLESAADNEISFLSNPRYKRQIGKTKAIAIITSNHQFVPTDKAALITPTPYLAFALALEIFTPNSEPPAGIHSTAVVSPSATLGSNPSIGPFTVIGDRARIGDNVKIHSHCEIYHEAGIGNNCIIHSHTSIRERCTIGDNVILQNSVVVGSDGFGYAKENDQVWHKIPQTGTVVIEDCVEVGAGTTIDRATTGQTRIGYGTKIDNLVQVGHGSVIGKHTMLCAQVGLAGSTIIGNEVILAGQVGVAGHLTIGDNVVVTAQSGIPNSVASNTVVSGYPAIPNRDWLRAVAVFNQLPKLKNEIHSLTEKIILLDRNK